MFVAPPSSWLSAAGLFVAGGAAGRLDSRVVEERTTRELGELRLTDVSNGICARSVPTYWGLLLNLIDKLLKNTIEPSGGPRKVIVRVLLDDEGRVQDVTIKRSSGDSVADARAVSEIRAMKFARGQLGSGPRTTRRWHELAYSIDR